MVHVVLLGQPISVGVTLSHLCALILYSLKVEQESLRGKQITEEENTVHFVPDGLRNAPSKEGNQIYRLLEEHNVLDSLKGYPKHYIP